MERFIGNGQVGELIKKYRYVVMVLLAGILLMLLPDTAPETQDMIEPDVASVSKSLEEELEDILSQLQGAGKIRVLLTESTGEETYFQQDGSSSVSEGGTDEQKDTVVLTDSERTQNGLVRRIDPPVYLGAVILCQGADSAAIRLAIVEAVANATGLSTDRISVLKMK